MELTKEIEERIPLLLSTLPEYGEFKLRPPEPRTRVVDGSKFLDPNNKILEDVQESILLNEEDQKEIRRIYTLDLKVMQYLIFKGFAFNRHDAKEEGIVYRELTAEGRKLRSAGTLKKYLLKKRFTPNSFWSEFFKLTISGAVGAGIVAVLQRPQTSPIPIQVSVQSPKVEIKVVHDTIRIDAGSRKKSTKKTLHNTK